jgi:hypothetical protein
MLPKHAVVQRTSRPPSHDGSEAFEGRPLLGGGGVPVKQAPTGAAQPASTAGAVAFAALVLLYLGAYTTSLMVSTLPSAGSAGTWVRPR